MYSIGIRYFHRLGPKQGHYKILTMFPMLYTVVQSQSHVWLFSGPMKCSPPGSSIHGISQARILGWVAISFSRRSSWPRDLTHISWIDRQILYCWAIREARVVYYVLVNLFILFLVVLCLSWHFWTCQASYFVEYPSVWICMMFPHDLCLLAVLSAKYPSYSIISLSTKC